jgi:hypothetical protein
MLSGGDITSVINDIVNSGDWPQNSPCKLLMSQIRRHMLLSTQVEFTPRSQSAIAGAPPGMSDPAVLAQIALLDPVDRYNQNDMRASIVSALWYRHLPTPTHRQLFR